MCFLDGIYFSQCLNFFFVFLSSVFFFQETVWNLSVINLKRIQTIEYEMFYMYFFPFEFPLLFFYQRENKLSDFPHTQPVFFEVRYTRSITEVLVDVVCLDLFKIVCLNFGKYWQVEPQQDGSCEFGSRSKHFWQRKKQMRRQKVTKNRENCERWMPGPIKIW